MHEATPRMGRKEKKQNTENTDARSKEYIVEKWLMSATRYVPAGRRAISQDSLEAMPVSAVHMASILHNLTRSISSAG